ncbi:hypothetical protein YASMINEVIRUS_1607 [Yasminevirus sp. GU-2018]|uniref:Xylose isomerase-like TIM barrel domain-containing protein n=1 Tax=Yasminevirus sp. GU-2018 TaxID=2420051 RepID=A0A5K0UBH4_9VIRU|nr:hypothetical protein YASMINEVIRUS_1607 [Yasminevirus sp. GU-2018]
MIMRGIVGYTGFVGSNLLARYKFDRFYNSKNFNEAVNMEFDELFFCGAPAVKWYANKHPEIDRETIDQIIKVLDTIQVKRFILISTVDVYGDQYEMGDSDEDRAGNVSHAYGKNRYDLEEFIRRKFSNHHIVRLPALIGKGLKKNVVYDLLNNNQISVISPNTQFQWYDLEWLYDDISRIIDSDLHTCNLVTEPLCTREILTMFNYSSDSYKGTSTFSYDITTKHGKIFGSSGKYIRDKETVLNSIKKFIETYNMSKDHLVVSNICLNHVSDFQFACILKLNGIKYVQIAPSRLINGWCDLSNFSPSVYTNNNVTPYSFQSIAYSLDDLNIFSHKSALLLDHLKKVVDCAKLNNVKVLVFGCPKNRKISQDCAENNKTFVEFFRKLGKYCETSNVVICIEPNSKQYNCNYLNKISEVGVVVRDINNKNVRMMVDIGNALMEDDQIEDVYKFADIVHNIDVSQKNMCDFSEVSKVRQVHRHFSDILTNINYQHKINLEMKTIADSPSKELNLIRLSLDNFIELYGKNTKSPIL